ncbi:unnamed protein product [Ostreobium quekettii]|uniref:Uncharacterized protein n=1 Tax=Ostreobium quekettii TaxID=121088 RepID=A0A8S1IW15_9CHLO|nr:unnamed protein product [Ostreobium quekettii]|eukprot:evm.model.scf_57.16 EVM.evm.TU.scf_57.16   scf_57:113552-116835(+)
MDRSRASAYLCPSLYSGAFRPAVASPEPSQSFVWKAVKPFFNGGLSGMMATCIIQPIDMVKVRIQLGAKGNPLAVGMAIARQDGVFALYNGLSAGLLRQATYTTARLGIFNTLSAELKEMNKGQNLPLWMKAACGLTAGGLGALVGTPADLSLIRMQADATLPPEQRRNYKNVLDALVRIMREEGFIGLFRGAAPTVTRAMALNMGMLASNDQAREMLVDAGFAKGSYVVILGGSTIAGFFASACSLPFDFVKTRMQRMTANPDGTMPYKGPIDCTIKTFTKEGPLKFYTGFPTYFIRIAPHVAMTLVFLDAIRYIESKNGL